MKKSMFSKSMAAALLFGTVCRWGMPNNTQAADAAVVLIDMQRKFLTPLKGHEPGFLEMRSQLVNAQMQILEWAKQRDYPVLVFEFNGYGETIEPLKSAVEAFDTHIFMQKWESGGFHRRRFKTPSPEEILKAWGARKLIIAGIESSACVANTAEEALEKGFEVFMTDAGSADLGHGRYPVYPNQKQWPARWYERYRFHNFPALGDLLASPHLNPKDPVLATACSALLQGGKPRP